MLTASRDLGKTWTEPLAVSDGNHSDWQSQVARIGDKVLLPWTQATLNDMHIWAATVPVAKVLGKRQG